MNLEKYLSLLQQAQSDEERAVITAEMSISLLTEPVQRVARQCGLLPWFDELVIAALLQESEAEAPIALQVEESRPILAQIAELPFVEAVDWGYQFHTTTAAGWWQKYAQAPFDFIIETHRTAAAGYLAQWETHDYAAMAAVQALLLSQQYDSTYEKVAALIFRFAGRQDWEALLSLFKEMTTTAKQEWVTPPPYPPLFWIATGLALGNLERHEESLAAYDRAIELNPEDATAYNNRGVALRNLERYEEALAAFDRAIELNPEYASAFYDRGVALGNLERYEEALAAFDRAIELNPEDASAFYNRGVALGNLERYEEALAAFDRAIELNPEYANAFYDRGVALGNLERYEEALAAFDRAIELNPEDASAFYNRGVALRNLERYEEAVAAYDRAIELNPEDASAFYNRACLEGLRNDVTEATRWLKKALSRNPARYLLLSKQDSDFELIKDDPRFQALLKKYS